MLLRSVMSHVRDQNWFAVGIDFMIVVIGVYVGIEVSNWNERRADAARAQEYLERIESDMAYNRGALEARRAFWSEVAEQGRLALAYAEEGELAEGSAWATLRAFFHASQVWRFTFNDTTYAEMLSAGELSLIESSELRSEFAEYFVVRGPRREEGMFLLLPEYRDRLRAAFPSTLTRYYWENCHWQVVEKQEIYPCEAPISEDEAHVVLDRLLADPELIPELRAWMSSLDLFINLAGLDIELSEELSAQLNAARR